MILRLAPLDLLKFYFRTIVIYIVSIIIILIAKEAVASVSIIFENAKIHIFFHKKAFTLCIP